MKKNIVRRPVFLICLLLLPLLVLPSAARAAAPGAGIGVYHKPAVTITVLHASPGAKMTVTMFHQFKGGSFDVKPRKENRGWEVCFRIYRMDVFDLDAWYGNAYDFKDAVVTLRDRDRTVTVPVPYEQLKEASFNDFLILDAKKGTLTVGAPWTRTAALVLMQLALYLLVESIAFRLLGIREKKSWLFFLIYTAVTKGLCCFYRRDWLNADPRIYIFFGLTAIFLGVLDMGVYLLTVDESKDNLAKFSMISNIAAGLVVFAAMRLLPLPY